MWNLSHKRQSTLSIEKNLKKRITKNNYKKKTKTKTTTTTGIKVPCLGQAHTVCGGIKPISELLIS